MTRVVDVDPLDPDDLTRAEIEARVQVMRLVAFFRERVPGFATRASPRPARRSAVRESRRIVGEYTLTRDDILERRTFDDAVARSAYPIDIHNPSGSGTTTHRLPAGTSYEIPYRCLVPRRGRRPARRRTLHLDDARSARVDALDADRDDAGASRRHRRRALVRAPVCRRARSTRACCANI